MMLLTFEFIFYPCHIVSLCIPLPRSLHIGTMLDKPLCFSHSSFYVKVCGNKDRFSRAVGGRSRDRLGFGVSYRLQQQGSMLVSLCVCIIILIDKKRRTEVLHSWSESTCCIGMHFFPSNVGEWFPCNLNGERRAPHSWLVWGKVPAEISS